MAKTLRGNPNSSTGPTPGSGTLRGNAPQPSGSGTLRGNAPQSNGSGTLRGNAPQPNGSGTLRGNAPQPNSGTMRGKPDQGKGAKAAGAPKANAPKQAEAANVRVLKKDLQQAGFTEFELNGVKYHVEGLISASTGEAEIYKLTKGGNEYALKLYYAGFYPDRQVIDSLLAAQGTGFIVDIIEYGRWQAPTGELREYELQPFYSGGDLHAGMMKGNAPALKATALSMLMAVKASHDHNILHRDIKPGNFLYADDSRAQLVLSDFGIAACFDTDAKGRMRPLKTRAQWRTKIYAAPEIYTVIDGEIVYDDVKSDYYSLGMTLLTLWMGEEPFADYDERTLLRIKKGESGNLPIADDMPPELQHLVRGLTVPNPDKRWGFDEFERWLRGEDVPVEGIKGQAVGLNILYSGSKNLVANTFEQLVQYMLDDRELARQYLYSGKISQWLADGGYPELQIQIDKFINKTYPKNQDAGLMATAYLLDGDLPFESPSGARLRTSEEIAQDMADNANKYLDIVADPNSSLYVYYRASGLNYADDFVPVARKEMELKALWRMIFTLNPNIGFPMYDVNAKGYRLVDTVEEMLDFFGTQPEHCYDDPESAYPELLYDEAFTIWLAHRDPALAGKIKSKLALENNSKDQLYYYIMYLLGPDRNLFIAKDRDNAFTIEQIAQVLNIDLMAYYVQGRHEGDYNKYQANYDRVAELVDLKDNRLYYYLKAKELYKDKFDYIAYCYELDSKDKKRQAGPYNVETATFKALKALNNGNAFYYFPKSDKAVYTIDQLDDIPDIEKLDELENGLLKWWLAVQYQEDPFADLTEDYAYELLLGDYTVKLGEIDADNEEVNRTVSAMNQVDDGAQKCRNIIRQVKVLRGVWGLLIALPLLAVALASVFVGFADFTHPDGIIELLIVGGVFAVVLRGLQMIPGVRYIIQNCVSVKLGDYFEDHRWLCAAFYPAVFLGLYFVLSHFGKLGIVVMPAFCILLLGLFYNSAIHSMPLMEDSYDDAINPDDEASVVEPLFFGWKDKGRKDYFTSETIERQETYIGGTSDERNSLIYRTLMGLIPVALTILVYFVVSPVGADWMREHRPAQWEKLFGEGVSAADSEARLYYADVRRALNVRVSPDANSEAIGSLGKGEQMEVLAIENGFARIKFGDSEGYVNAAYIKPVNPEPEVAPAESKPAKSAGNAASQPAASAPAPAETASEAASAETADAPEPTYEVVDRVPSAAPQGELYTTRSNYTFINMYDNLSASGEEIATIPNGATFRVLEHAGGIAKISYNGKIGYVQEYVIQKAE